MSAANGNGTWKRFVLQLVIPTAVALMGYGALKADVRNLREQVDTKASRETIEAQYQSIMQRLDRIERKLDQR